MKILIVYKSRHHTTELYARWIHQEVESDLVNVDYLDKKRLKDYDIIAFGSWIYKDKIQIADYIKSNWNVLKDKKVVLFSVGLTQPEDMKTKIIYQISLPTHIRDSISYFPLWGKLHLDGLNIFEKIVLKMHKKFRELDQIEERTIRPIVVKLYDLKVVGEKGI